MQLYYNSHLYSLHKYSTSNLTQIEVVHYEAHVVNI